MAGNPFYFIIAILSFLNGIAVYWLPFVLGAIAWYLWMDYRRRDYISKIQWKMIEVALPREVTKSPLAMEVVLGAFHDLSGGNWLDKYYKGRVPLWSSLEIVSIEGRVRFFIRVPQDFKNNLEAKIYSQYPGIEVYEAEDYTKNLDYKDGTWEMFGTEWVLVKPDPYPIRTYVDYGLNTPDMKPETQIDPITPVIEFLGSFGKGEQVWIQIMVQAAQKRFSKGGLFSRKQGWKDEADRLVKKLQGDKEQFQALTIGQQGLIGSIQRAVTKIGLDCGMRGIYFAKKDKFSPLNIGALINTMKQFGAEGANGFKPDRMTKFDYPWQDYKKKRINSKKRSMYDAYIRRSYFYAPYKRKPFVLNSEELATIFHFPARSSDTPGFVRLESQKSQPPQNLPI